MTTALSAGLAAVIAGLVSVITSRWQIRAQQIRARLAEVQLDTEVQLSYAQALIARRHECYPRLGLLLSDAVKRLQTGGMDESRLVRLLGEINEWDSQHSLLLSGRSMGLLYDLRRDLARMVKSELSPEDLHEEFRLQVGELETALRSDLGVYIVEFRDSTMRDYTFREQRLAPKLGASLHEA